MEGRRKHVRRACTECALAHSACSDVRPCTRCVTRGLRCKDPKNKKRIRIVDESSHFASSKKRRMQPWESSVDLNCMVASFHPSELDPGKLPPGDAPRHPPQHKHQYQHVTHHQHEQHGHQYQHEHVEQHVGHHQRQHQQVSQQHLAIPHSHPLQHQQHSHIPQQIPHHAAPAPGPHHPHLQHAHQNNAHPYQHQSVQQKPQLPLGSEQSPRAPVDANKYYANRFAASHYSPDNCGCSGSSGTCDCTGCHEDSNFNRRDPGYSGYSGPSFAPSGYSRSSGNSRYPDFAPADRRPGLQHVGCCCLPPLSPLRPILSSAPTPPPSSISALPNSPRSATSQTSISKDSVLPSIAGLMESLSRSPSHDDSEKKPSDSELDVKPNVDSYNQTSCCSPTRLDSNSISPPPPNHDGSNGYRYSSLSAQTPPNHDCSNSYRYSNPGQPPSQNPTPIAPSGPNVLQPKLGAFRGFLPHLRGVV